LIRWPALLLLAIVAGTEAPAQDIRVAQVSGMVTRTEAGKPDAVLKPKDRIRAGDQISTGPGAVALLRLQDGSTVEVFPGSQVIFQDPARSTWKDFLEVLLGVVKIHVEKLSGRPNPKSVTTPTAIIAVRGTIFNVQVDQEATKVGVEEGLVSVAAFVQANQEVLLEPGFQTLVRPGQAPTPPQPDGNAPASHFGAASPSSNSAAPNSGGGPGRPPSGGPAAGRDSANGGAAPGTPQSSPGSSPGAGPAPQSVQSPNGNSGGGSSGRRPGGE